MKTTIRFYGLALGLCAALLLVGSGCSKEKAAETVKDAEEAVDEAAETVAKDAVKVAKEGEKLAGKLGEKALAYLSPLKEKLGNLETLKETPDELKKAVTELIQSIEDKTEDIELPEAVSSTLATVKEKLVGLKNYLEGEVEQAKIEEHIKEIMDSVKSGLGMSDE